MCQPWIGMLPTAAPPAAIEGGIDDNATEPRQRCGVPAEPMAGTKRTKKRILHHVFGILADVACGNRPQLAPGLFVQVHYRVFQGTLHRGRLQADPMPPTVQPVVSS